MNFQTHDKHDDQTYSTNWSTGNVYHHFKLCDKQSLTLIELYILADKLLIEQLPNAVH